MCKNNFAAKLKWTKLLKVYKGELSKDVLLVISALTWKVTLVQASRHDEACLEIMVVKISWEAYINPFIKGIVKPNGHCLKTRINPLR